MKFPTKTLLLLLSCVIIAAADVRALTMDHAVVMALQNNRDLRAATYEVEKARGRLIQAGLWPNPALEFSHATDRTFHNEGERATTAGFQQAFPIAGRLAFAKRVSRVEVAQAMAEIRNRERLLIGEVQRDFLTVLLLRQQISANRELVGANRDFADVLRARFDRAEVSEVEVNLARAEQQRLAVELAVLEGDLVARELALKLRLGLGPENPIAPQGNLEALLARFAPEKYATTMVVNRPDLRQTELGIDRTAAEVRLAKAEAWEDWTLGVEYEEERGVDEPRGLTTDKFLAFKISIPIALWNRNQGKLYEHRAAAEQAQEQFEAQRLSIRSEIATAIARARSLRGAVGNYSRDVAPALTQSNELVRRGYSDGLIPPTQVIQVQQQQGALRSAFLSATATYLQALVDLETATASSPYL
ncbi:MAG: TolC family protein, partial [Chthoniobacterales bacterium]|nr:TolC family protein [Chthoniobacterales bacterium]